MFLGDFEYHYLLGKKLDTTYKVQVEKMSKKVEIKMPKFTRVFLTKKLKSEDAMTFVLVRSIHQLSSRVSALKERFDMKSADLYCFL